MPTEKELKFLRGLIDYHRHFWMGMDCLSPIVIQPFFNLQKYEPSEGYVQMHCERGSSSFPMRTHAWMIYLNDIEEGGQTEFPYQNLMEEPKAGNLIIWPSDFTHIHRGIPAPNEIKYILTGWIGFEPDEGCDPVFNKPFKDLPAEKKIKLSSEYE